MLGARQVLILSGIAALFWIAATAWIRWFPSALVDPLQGGLGFLFSIPVCWLCVHLGRRAASLSAEQLVPGTAVVVAVATLIDAVALRWAHLLYADSEQTCRLGAAWLLWGYGVSLGIALLMRHRLAVVGAGTPRPA